MAQCASGLRNAGVGEGDRVAAVVANCPEAVIAMLAATSLGAIWSSCSPDFGISGIHDRLGQISPQVLITVNAYHYNGKEHDCLGKVRKVAVQIPSLQALVAVPFTETPMNLQENEVAWSDFLDASAQTQTQDGAPAFEQFPFSQPSFILYSSGTTGLPKSIVHGTGGTLLKHLSEHRYHSDVHPGDRLFYYTTCGWMMWNWLVSGLASAATLILYDGAPSFPDMGRLWRLIEDERITHFGISPKFLGTVQKSGYVPRGQHDLSSLRSLMSTGSTLPEELFEWVYQDVADHPEGEFYFFHGRQAAELFGYRSDWLDRAPPDAVASFAGVGNPHLRSNVQPGETVLDLGSGAGLDAIIASWSAGPTGKVIGIDLNPYMCLRAQAHATARKRWRNHEESR